MVRINLIPVRQVKKREVGRQQLVGFAALVIVGIVGNVLWIGHVQDQVDRSQANIAKLQREISALDAAIGEVGRIKKEKADLEDKLKVLDTLKKKRAGPVKVMDSLAQLMPAHVWVTSVDEKGGAVQMQGLGMTNDDVVELMRELKKSQYFSNIVLKKVSVQTASGPVNQVVQFEITCNVTYSV